MSMPTTIQDGQGDGHVAGVTGENALKVSVQSEPLSQVAPEVLTRTKLFREYITNEDGESIEMNVDADPTVNYYSKQAEAGKVISITEVRFIFHDQNMAMDAGGQVRDFGSAADVPGLTNGILMQAIQGGAITNLFPAAVQSMADFAESAAGFTNFEGGIANGVDFLSWEFMLPGAVILPDGSQDKFQVVIRDDLTDINYFRCVISGTQEIFE